MSKTKQRKIYLIPMSISKAQAAALADGFLDDLGSDEKSDIRPKETLSELFLIAGELIEDAQKNIKSDNSNASGALSKSLELHDPIETGDTVKVDILMNFYGQFVNKGVKGTKSGKGLYQFKSSFPSRDMLKALVAGVARAKKSTSNTSKKTVRANEKKNLKISELDKVYGAARNIKMYGIKATGFMDKAITAAEKKIDERLSKALSTDIINSLQDGDNDTVNTGNL